MANKNSWLLLAAALLGFTPLANSTPMWSADTHDVYFGDFNGDHRTDMLYIAKDPAQQSGIVLSTSVGGTLGESVQTWASNFLGIPWHSGTYKAIVGDFNGDGRDDIFLQRQTPGDHYLLLANEQGQISSIYQTLPNNTGGQLWSADSHRIIAGDFNGDGRRDLFLQSVTTTGLHALFLADPTYGTFSTPQQTWSDGKFGFAWSLSKANVYAGDFTGGTDHRDDLFVQGKPTIVIIQFDVPFPVPSYRPGSFGIMQAKALNNNDIFYMPVFDSWNRMDRGGDWSGTNYRAVVADFNGDGHADIFLQGKNANLPNRLILSTISGQISSTDSLTDSTLRNYSQQQGLVHAGNFDGTGGAGVYLQSATSSASNQFSESALATVSLVGQSAPSVSRPAPQVYTAFTSAVRYNLAGQVTGTISADPDNSGPLHLLAVRNHYNSDGLLDKVERGQLTSWPDETVSPSSWAGYGFSGSNIFGSIEYSYDGYGRKTKELMRGLDGSPEGLVQYSYDSENFVRCKAVRMSNFLSPLPDPCGPPVVGAQGPDRIYRYTNDIYGQVLQEERAVGTTLAQTYATTTYNMRVPASYTDANGNLTVLSYDGNGRLKRRKFPDPSTPGVVSQTDYNEYTYDLNGNVLTERKRSGAMVTYTIDALNRVTKKDLSDNSKGDDIEYTYDGRGLTQYSRFVNSPLIGVFSKFDGFGRLTQATNVSAVGAATASRSLQYSYDPNGNRTQVKHPDNTVFNYFFDGLNRVRCASEGGDCSSTDAGKLITVQYRSDGKRDHLLRPGGATTNYSFDNAGRLQGFGQDLAGGISDDVDNTFAYNPPGQITQLTYNNAAYSPSGNSNRPGNYSANGLNQYTSVAGSSMLYDANGNLTQDAGASTTFGYDIENRLVSVTGPQSGTLKYDPLGRLTEYTAAPTAPVQFLYDGNALVAEYQVSGNSSTLTRRYVHGDQVDEPWVQYNGSSIGASARRYLHADHQGSILSQSNASGSILGTKLAYDAYGIPGSSNYDRFGYTGQLWLKELGLDYYKARIYQPKLGRFLQTDSIFYQDDMNLYAYVGNDPLNKTDPTGLCETVNGQIANCEVIMRVPDPKSANPNYPYRETPWSSLTAQEKAPLQSQYDETATVGQAVQNTGSAGEKASWAGTTSIVLAPQENPTDANGSRTLANHLETSVGGQLTFFAGAITNTPENQRFVAGHEIEHGVEPQATESRNVESMAPGAAQDAARLLMEQHTDQAAVSFLRPRGLIGPKICVSGYSGCL